MDFFSSLNISASGLSAQTTRLNVISSNLANVHTTQTVEGGPYKRRDVIFAAVPSEWSFSDILQHSMGGGVCEVQVVGIVTDQDQPKKVYQPNHPEADESGYVSLPNVNVVEEMVNMLAATRSYEANVTAIQSAKSMALKALEIGK